MGHDFSKNYWDNHYQDISSKNSQPMVNTHLVNRAGDLATGIALDVGCGEGADAVWLAQKGWKVVAVDISSTVIEKAKDFAEGIGVAVDFRAVDATSWTPEKNHYNLVTSHYVHTTDNQAFVKKLSDAVKPDGMLLVVGHQPSVDHETTSHAHGSHITAEEIASYLSSDEWSIEVAEPRTITKTTPNGKSVLLNDSVFIALKKNELYKQTLKK